MRPHPAQHVDRDPTLMVGWVHVRELVARPIRPPAVQSAMAVASEGFLIEKNDIPPVVCIVVPAKMRSNI